MRATDVPTPGLLEAVATRWLEDMVTATAQTHSALFACVRDSHGRELRIGRAIPNAFILGKKKTHPNPLGEFPVEQSCPQPALCLSSASPWLWILVPEPDQSPEACHLLAGRKGFMYSGAVDDISTLL